jgi:sec-independent protein translocase protein TatB
VFDIAPSEFLLVIVVALVVIGPKDLPRAMRVVGHWVGRARAMTRHFRSGIDTMMREAELDELQRQWAAENERIMREHPAPTSIPSLLDDGYESETADRAVTMPQDPEPLDRLAAMPEESQPAPRALPSARPPEELAAEAEPQAEPARRLRRGSELDEGSVP